MYLYQRSTSHHHDHNGDDDDDDGLYHRHHHHQDAPSNSADVEIIAIVSRSKHNQHAVAACTYINVLQAIIIIITIKKFLLILLTWRSFQP